MTITWNPSDKGANVTLSNGNLTATFTSGDNSVRATDGASSGKLYFEVHVDTHTTSAAAGVMISSATLTNHIAFTSGGWSYYSSDGHTYTNNVGTATGTTFGAGDIVGVAVDLDADKIWFAKNNVWVNSGNPSAGTNQAYTITSGITVYPATNGTTSSVTGRFISADFTYTVPTGFTAWGGTTVNAATIAVTEDQDTAALGATALLNPLTFAVTEAQDTSAFTTTQADIAYGSFAGTVTSVTLNPSDTGTTISLSNGNLTATKSGSAWKSSRATTSRSTGKYYFETTQTGSTNHMMIGLADNSVNIESYQGASASGDTCWSLYEGIYYNGSAQTIYSHPTATVGQTISLAVDLDAKKVWWAKDGVWLGTGSPAAGTDPVTLVPTGSLFPCISLIDASATVTVNLGATAFTYTPPSGFNAWGTETLTEDADTFTINITNSNIITITFTEPADTFAMGITEVTTATVDMPLVETQDSSVFSGVVAQGLVIGTIGDPVTSGTVTWNPATKGSHITLSNGDLSASSSTFSIEHILGTATKSFGKWYFEVTLDTTSGAYFPAVGVGNAITTNLGIDSHSWGYYTSATGSNLLHNNVAVSGQPDLSAGDVWGIAVDLDLGNIWFSRNGTFLDDGIPESGSGPQYTDLTGDIFPIGQLYASGGTAAFTANFGATTFAHTIPTGFAAWDDDVGRGGLTETQDTADASVTSLVTIDVNFVLTESPDTPALYGGQGSLGTPILVAVGDSGTLRTSIDNGATWASVSTGITKNINAVIQNDARDLWVLVCNSGQIWTTPDLVTFTQQTSPTIYNLHGVDFHDGVYVAVGEGLTSGQGHILTSLDGIVWTDTVLTTAAMWRVHYGDSWVAVGNSGRIYSSVNGVTWTLRSNPVATMNARALHYDSVWVASGGNRLITSSNGTSWTERTVTVSGSAMNCVYHSDTLWMAGANSTTTFRSTNATSTPWSIQTVRTPPTLITMGYNGIIWDGTVWVMVGGIAGTSVIVTSPDATTWTERSGSTSNIFRDVSLGFVPGSPYIAGTMPLTEVPDTFTLSLTTSVLNAGPISATEDADLFDIEASYIVDTVTVVISPTEGQDIVLLGLTADVGATNVGTITTVETQDSFSSDGQAINASIIVTIQFTEPPDIASASVSVRITGTINATDEQDTVLISQGGGTNTLTIHLLPATFDEIVTFGASIFNGGTVDLYSGSQPGLPSDPATGVHLGTITVPDPGFTEASDGSATKAGDWTGTAIDSGVVGWFRLTDTTGDNIIDGSTSTTSGGGNMIMSATNVSIGDPLEVTTVNFEFVLLDSL